MLEYLYVADTWTFAVSALAILPLAGRMGRATEELAVRTGSTIGGPLNATSAMRPNLSSPFSP